jgi:LPS-assembly lipoprotein
LQLGGLLGLAGCGFHPMYGPAVAPDGTKQDVIAELAAVRVGQTYERSGQLLRRSLMRRMEGMAPGTAAKYQLNVSVNVTGDAVGFRQDGTISRIRYVVTGNWVLTTLSVPPLPVARSAIPYRTLDSFDVPDLQFFAADVGRDAMEARLMEDLSQEITRDVLIALRRRKEGRDG